MKRLFFPAFSFLLAATAAAQNVGIGTTTPQATLEVSAGSGEKVVASLGVLLDPILSVEQTATNGTFATHTEGWQSFKALESGYLHSVEFGQFFIDPRPATVSIFEGEGISGTLLGSVLLDLTSPDIVEWQRTPLFIIPIIAGETYTIHHSSANSWFYSTENPYAGGISSIGNGTDFQFRVYTMRMGTEYFRVSGDNTPVAWTVSGNEIITGNSVISGNSVIAGKVGIGTNTPRAPLHVLGTSDSISSAPIRYFNSGSTDLGQENNWKGTTAGYFEGNVVSTTSFISSAVATFSDERIKKIKGISDGTGDLETLKHIEITDYSMIDSVQHPDTYKKVIAQQVEQHLPQAVSLYSDYIPSIFAEAKKVTPDASPGLLKISLATPHQLKAGDEIKLMTEKQGEQLVTVAAVGDAITFSVASSDQDWGKIFVYGKKVDDFRVVDYDAISMLNVSATQELARKVEQLEQEKRTWERDKRAMEARLEMSEQKYTAAIDALRNDVATLKNLLLPEKVAEN